MSAIKDYSQLKVYPMPSKRFSDIFFMFNRDRMGTRPTGDYFSGFKSLQQTVAAKFTGTGSGYNAQATGARAVTNGSGQTPDQWTIYAPAYDGTPILNYPIVAYVRVQQIQDLTLPTGFFQAVNSSWSTYPTIATAGMTQIDFLALYGEKYVITEISFYDNSDDGSVSLGNVRPFVGTVSSGTPSTCVELFMRFYASLTFTTSMDYDILIPIFQTFFLSKLSAMGGYNSIEYAHTLFLSTTTFSIYEPAKIVGDPMQNVKGELVMFETQDIIASHLNEVGLPFTFIQTQALNSNTEEFEDYVPIGQPTNGTGGGTGTGDNLSDEIIQTNPDISVLGTFNKHYAITQSMLNVFSNYLWTSTFLDDLKLLFNNPMEGVVSCRMMPFSLSAHDSAHIGGSELIQIGNVVTTAPAYPIASGYNGRFDLGSLSIDEYFGSALDYEPYTKLSLYLPYIGIKDLSTNDFMGRTLSVKYIVDITTGACIAQIWSNDQMLYSYDGKIGVEIPINSSNAAQMAAGLAMTAFSAIGSLAASGGNPLAVAGTVLATAQNVASNQFHINKGGVNSPFASFYMPQYPFLIINRPIQSLASSFGKTHGFPCNVTKMLSTLTGFTQIDEVQLNGINATSDELTEIYALLKQGVIL